MRTLTTVALLLLLAGCARTKAETLVWLNDSWLGCQVLAYRYRPVKAACVEASPAGRIIHH